MCKYKCIQVYFKSYSYYIIDIFLSHRSVYFIGTQRKTCTKMSSPVSDDNWLLLKE